MYNFNYLLLGFIIFNFINLFLLSYKDKHNKISIILAIISLIFASYFIWKINHYYIYTIIQEFDYSEEKMNWFLNKLQELNRIYFYISLLLAFILFIISFKIRYPLFYILTITILIISFFTLMSFYGMIITKTIIDMSLLSCSLMTYYLNYATIPLFIKKYRVHILHK